MAINQTCSLKQATLLDSKCQHIDKNKKTQIGQLQEQAQKSIWVAAYINQFIFQYNSVNSCYLFNMINCQKMFNIHKKTDEFTSYFSSIPELPEFKLKGSKDKVKKMYSLQSLTKDFSKKPALNSKRQYELVGKKSTNKKKVQGSIHKKLTGSCQYKNLHAAVLALSPKALNSRSSSYRLSQSLKKSIKTSISQMHRTRSSGTRSTRKLTSSIVEMEQIYTKCSALLLGYQEKVKTLSEENRKLQQSNTRMRLCMDAENRCADNKQ